MAVLLAVASQIAIHEFTADDLDRWISIIEWLVVEVEQYV